MYDLIIKNANIIDGSGAQPYRSDVAILNGKISKIDADITDSAKEVIDASSLILTPGFIDSHSHSDNAIFEFPEMKEKIEQGITSSVAGQCGSSFAPVDKDLTAENSPIFEGYGKMCDVCKNFGTMAEAIKDTAFGSNIKILAGHNSIRKAVIGYEDREPTAQEFEQMKALLRDAMEHGALGLSYGLYYTPGCYAKTDELIELAKVVKEYNGILTAHIRDESFKLVEAVEEFLTVVKAVDVTGVLSHHKSAYKPNWGLVNKTLAMIDDAVKEGYNVYCDVYPYGASSTILTATVIATQFRGSNNAGIAKSLSDPDMRAKIKEAFVSKYGDSLSHLLLTECNGFPQYVNMRINEVAKLRGQDDFDAAFDLIAGSNPSPRICSFTMCEEDIETVLRYSRTMIGTDSSVAKNSKAYHPRLRGTFPRVLGRYVRERNVISLTEAIRKATSMPAEVYRFRNKGLIREGYDADICIFNADTIIDRAEYVNCHERCEGLSYVILGGEVVVKDAVFCGNKKGRFIPDEERFDS